MSILSSAVIEAAQEAIVLFDREGVVREFNPMAEQIFGRSREQAVGRNLMDFAIPPRLIDTFKMHLEAAYREGKIPQRMPGSLCFAAEWLGVSLRNFDRRHRDPAGQIAEHVWPRHHRA